MDKLVNSQNVIRYLVRVVTGIIILPFVFCILCPLILLVDYILDDKSGGALEILTDTFGLLLWRTL